MCNVHNVCICSPCVEIFEGREVGRLCSTCPTVIVEATYGVSRHLPREGREQRFVNMIRSVVQRGGRCLLPVVALGRAQVPPFLGVSRCIFWE